MTVHGPVDFNLLAVWSQKRPTYVRSIWHGLDVYLQFLKAAPSVVAGDFNSHSKWDQSDLARNHTTLVAKLRDEFDLVSAYHSFPTEGIAAQEEPTLYWQWQENQGFHIDYCFIPNDWTSKIRDVNVGDFDNWKDKSDHRPLVVDLNFEVTNP